VKNLGENFDEEWFSMLKRDMRDLTETKYSLMSILNKLKDVTTQTPARSLYNLVSRFNQITLEKLQGIYQPGKIGQLFGVRGTGPTIKAAQNAIEAWLGKKANMGEASIDEIARLRREVKKFKEITEEE